MQIGKIATITILLFVCLGVVSKKIMLIKTFISLQAWSEPS